MSSALATLMSGLCLAATVQSSVTTAKDLVTVARMIKAAQRAENAARQCGEDAAFLENLREAKALLSSWSPTGSSSVPGMWDEPSLALLGEDCRLILRSSDQPDGTQHEFFFQPHRERNPNIDTRLPNWRPRWHRAEDVQ